MKKIYHLATTNHGKTEYFQLNSKKPLKLKAKADTKYKVYDDEGKVIHDVRLDFVGDDVHVYLPHEQEVALLLENYQNYATINNITELIGLNATLATTTPVASSIGLSTIATGVGAIGLGATAILGNANTSHTNTNNAERLEKEQAEKERLEKEKAEKERLEKEQAEKERLEKEKAEKERLEKEKAEKERLEKEQAEKERLEKEQAEKERLEKEKAEKERLEKEKAEKERLEKEKAEKERLEKEKAEKERLEKEQAEKERLEKEKAEKERLEKEQAEKERLEKEKAEKERLEKEQAEKERLEKEKAEKERLEKEQAEADELAKNPPKITFNNITEDNIINLSESQATLAVTGTVANSKAGDVLTITIGTASQTVTITDGQFTLNLDGKTLIVHNEIGATLSRNGKDISTTAHSYQVDTEIEKPTINFNNIAGDNVINLKESEGKVTVSGTVENAKDGDEILLSCGCPSCTGVEWVDIKTTIQNGGFSVDFNGADMVGNGRNIIKASLTTSDDAKNTATGTAEKSYGVDITPPEPSFVYEKIGKDGIINAKIAENDIVLRGRVINLGENETVAVKVVVNGQDFVATKNGEYYQVAIASSEFANGQDVRWHLTAKDKAGNEKIIEQNQSYIYDVTLNNPTVEIATNNQIINNQSKGLTLSGSLNFDADVSSVKVDVILNNQTHSATVNGKAWTVSLPENIVKQNQGNNDFVVKISVADTAGNVAQNQSVGKFVVDTVAPQVQITLNPIGEIAPTGAEKVALSGTVSGEFKPTDKVKLSVNGTEFVANIAQNGTFSVEVPRTALIQNASKTLSASLETSDTAGNIGTATIEQNYTVGAVVTPPNTPKPISIQLDSLTSDDLINVTESKQATSKISGTVANADGQTVEVKIGEQTHNAQVQNGKFSLNINTQDLIQNANGKIVATVGGQTIERAYAVDDFATSQLQITEIGEHFQVFAPNDTVQFTGKVDLSGGILGKWNNASFINSIQATLNGKTYLVGLNADKTFTLNIPLDDVKQAEGQGFTFSLPENRFSVYDLKSGRYSDSPMDYTAEYARLDDQSKYQLNDNPLFNNGKIVAPQTDLTAISGVVRGKATVGDTVVVQVGEHRHETQVEQGDKGLIFRVNVPTEQLLGVANETISATLSGRDWQNKDYEISVLAKYEIGNADDKFAVTHPLASTNDIATDPKAPYFVQAMAFSVTQGHLLKHPVGQNETAHLTYRFKPSAGSESTFNESNREETRKVLKMFEKYANITFTEVGDNDNSADIGYVMTDGGSANGFADYGGNVWLNGARYQNGGLELKGRLGYMTTVHETLHSLGAKHPFEGRAKFPSEENDKMVSFMNYVNKFNDAKLELPMYDLLYLHYRYGVNKSARTENNTYKFNAFNPNAVDGDVYVWDGGGVDTFDASDQKQGVTVDLTPGSWVHSGAKSQNFLVDSVKTWNAQTFFNNQSAGRNLSEIYLDDKTPTYTIGQAFIGYGTQIERLIGSDFSDSLKGNIANNDIYGNDGNDTIFGDAGNDYLDGGKGADALSGGLGNDVFVVDDVGDQVIENADEGTDTVYAHIDYTLGDNVENLTLFGTATKGVGNALDNRMVGNGQANTLTGGAGQDTFVFNDVLDGNVDTITDFTVGEDKIELNPLVFVGLTAENLAQRIQYDSKTGHLTYDPDGSDKADVIHFATLANKPNLTVDGNHFVLSGATSSTTNTPTTPVTPKPSAHILYVSDEQKENHFATFEQALAQAKTGSTIVLMKSDTVLGNYTQDNDGRVNALNLPEITIDGQGHTLKVAVRPLSLLGDTTFKNMTLALQPLVSLNGAFASLGSGGATEGEQFIFLNGHKATFDQVSTQIDGQHPRTRPTIIMGAEKNQTDAGHAELVVLNADKTGGQTQFKNIIAGSSESDKTTDSLLNLGRGTVVLDQVIMGGTENHRMTGAVKVQNASSAVQNFNGENVANDEVILNNVDYLNAPALNQINDLTLSGTSGFTTPHLNIGGILTLGENSRLTVSAGLFSDDDASLVVGGLHSDNATLNLGDTATMDLNGNIKGTLTVKTTEQDVIRTDNSNAHIKQIEEGYLLGDKPFGDTNVNVPQAEIVFDDITDDNIINKDEANAPTITLSGSLKNALAGDVLTVKIGSVTKTVEIQDNGFTFNLDGKTLAVHQAISAELTRNGAKIAETTHAYRVDTEIDTPEITFRPITDDNTINLLESRNKINVSGTVQGAKDGDEITISCGCPTCTGVEWVDIKTTVQNGGFSVDFNGSDMVANGRTVVKASVTTSDDAKNTATGTAQQSYDVDITPPEPSFVYDEIGNNGVINREIAQNNIVLKGKIANLGENETVAVKVVVNGKDYTATKNGDYYQASVASSEFASGQAVKWHLTARDKAGNEKIIEQNQSYTYDVALNAPTVEIATNNQIINMQSKGLTLSGSLNFDNDVNKSSVKVDILLNNQTYSANVNTESKTWTVSLPENIAKQHQGDNAFTVKISVADNAGNVAENQSVGKFVVDTIAPQITVTLNNIGEITQTGTEKVTLSGTVSGEFKPSDKVKVSVNGTEFVANIAQNATFSVEVPRTALIQNASKKILASLETTDTAGNVGTASSEQNYSVPNGNNNANNSSNNPNKNQAVQLDKITSDDVINVTESKIATTKITGTASGADGQTVTLRFGDKTATATVQNGKFSVDINTQDLVENQSGKMIATLGGKTIERAYSVDNFASAQIKISEMAEIAPSEMVRLTGKVKLEGLFAQYQNPIQLQSFVATLNGKEYAVAVNTQDQTFVWNISLQDLADAKGKEISFVNKGGLSLYYVEDGKARYQNVPTLDKSAYQFDNTDYIVNGAVKADLPTAQTLIQGTVSGSAKVGDTVTLNIGNETVNATVQDGLRFAVAVDNAVLKQADKIFATWSGQNHQGQTISVNTEHAYKTGSGSLKGDFVTKFVAQSEAELPYFITGLETIHKDFGYLKRFAYGEGAKITYSFNKEYYAAEDWTLGNRKAVREALGVYAKYANIEFVELEDNSGVNTTDGKGRADIEFHHRPLTGAAGRAEFGGNVYISTSHQSMETQNGFHVVMHEIGHSLGMKHTHETPYAMNYYEDHTGVSVMAYKSTRMDVSRWDIRLYDIAFVQYRYGVNKNARAGDDIYTFKAFNPQSPDGDIYIWDGAGVDTFDASKEHLGVTVDLTPGSWIYRGEKAERLAVKDFNSFVTSTYFTGYDGNVQDDWSIINGKKTKYEYSEGQAFIGYGTQIERLIGSEHADSLKGNIADNEIFGGNGDDLIDGRDGNDYLDGGLGADTLDGGKGDDIFVVDNANDVVVENYLEGTDTVHSYAQSYTLSPNVENISLFGVAEVAIGNELDNRIVGNELSNILTGGAGADTFVFSNLLNGSVDTITDFNVSEDTIALALSVFDNLTADNVKDHIKYDSQTGALSYDKDGAGEADAVQFATLQNKPHLTIEEMNLILV